MCRIAGIVSNLIPPAERRNKVAAMCNTLAHGGPDDEGFFCNDDNDLCFGHRRLSIIDLSSAGHQPMADVNQQVWITFNGEIYNYPELKHELTELGAVFVSQTDTEVIIMAYLHWGVAAFGRLQGMFAFGLHDAGQGMTYLVRDTSGIKPLYYYAYNAELYFASEVRAFRAAGLITKDDASWPVRFLAYGFIPEPYTTLQDVYSLPKGCYLSWRHSNNYSQIDRISQQPPADMTTGHEQAQQQISIELNKAVKRQMIADAPIGVFLSGGIDSSLITLLAAKTTNAQLKTVSIYFDEAEYDERLYQHEVLKAVNCENVSHLVTRTDFEQALPQILEAIDMPTNDGINTWFISKYARLDGLKAVLSGLGADELFGGYPSFYRVGILNLLKRVPKPLLKISKGVSSGRYQRISLLVHDHPHAEYLFLRGLFVPEDISSILGIPVKVINKILFGQHYDDFPFKGKERITWLESNLYMQNQLLRDTDVMSMSHGLEVRVPFLDEEFRNTVDTIAPDIRYEDKPAKKLLIDSFKDILPRAVWDRRKMGFSFPLQSWMRQHDPISNSANYQNEDAAQVINEFKQGRTHWSRAYALYQLQKNKALTKNHNKNVLLLTLQTYSTTGGIQKMTRVMGYTLQKIAKENNWDFNLWSGYDTNDDNMHQYTDKVNFRGFGVKRSYFLFEAIKKARYADVVILTHINLASIGILVKKINPGCKVWLIAHGIEVWRPLNAAKKRLLKSCDKVVCVSHFTKQKVVEMHGVPETKCTILNNAIDPFIRRPENFDKPGYLKKRYHIDDNDQVVLTLTRLSSNELYKGYDQVIKAISILKEKFPHIKYILAGPYDKFEGQRIAEMIKEYSVEQQVIFTGYLQESELKDHFLLADLFVLPSKKEGFGIVFIEAMACGLPVICGNADGSMDAIRNGELGHAVNADDVGELSNAIDGYLSQPFSKAQRRSIQQKCMAYFHVDTYKSALEILLNEKE